MNIFWCTITSKILQTHASSSLVCGLIFIYIYIYTNSCRSDGIQSTKAGTLRDSHIAACEDSLPVEGCLTISIASIDTH